MLLPSKGMTPSGVQNQSEGASAATLELYLLREALQALRRARASLTAQQ